jgi:flagellar motility protein MotE (MotC chaperone)
MSSGLDGTAWITAFGGLLTAGAGKLVFDVWREWRTGASKNVSAATSSLNVVSMARDELVEDNSRLRQELVDQDARHARERERWLSDQERLRAEIRALEQRLADERAEWERRYDNLQQAMRRLRESAAMTQDRTKE